MYLLIIASIYFYHSVECSYKTEYYENILYQKTSEAESFQLPLNNEEFREGIDSAVVDDFGSFDFIIVGAGSAGSVLATRLSEIDNFTILLIEAGGEEDDFNNIPSMFSYVMYSNKNWGYYSTPQTTCCLGMKDQKCMIPRGKSIGGSSAINALMYVRGNPNDYNQWAELGNPGWSYNDVLPYFIKAENSQIDGDLGYHGKEGFWNVEYPEPPSPLFPNFIRGSNEIGLPTLDYNGINQYGVSQTQFNIKQGRRQSLGTAFLSNARRRKNLTVITKALATKILINTETNVANGIEFVTTNRKFKVAARKEVIISAGAINTPQLLMLSGIGPRDHLEKLGIKVIADLPVGKNLLEHPLFSGLKFHTNYTSSDQNLEQLIESFLNGYGPMTKILGIEGIGFIQTGQRPTNRPTIEYFFSHTGIENEGLVRFLNPTSNFTIALVLLHEKSRGEITLNSNNPIDFPNINLNMLSEQEDVDNLIEGVQFVLNLAKTASFKTIDAELIDIPVCTNFTKYSRQYWECLLRQMSTTIYHPCGTTAMGSDPTTSVVDHNLKVHGIGKLRIVDAGVFPTTISGHTNAATVMVAEKISDVIKNSYK